MVRGPVYAIIINFRTPDLTASAARSLLRSATSGRNLDLSIVDNGSGDGGGADLGEQFPDSNLLQSDRNLGFAGGNNMAIRDILSRVPDGVDRSDTFILLVNSDVVVEPDALQRCLCFMEKHRDVGAVGPKVLLPDGRLDLACRRSFPTPKNAFWKLTGLSRRFPDNPRFARYNLTYLDEDQTADVDAVTGAFMLVRLSAIDHAGLLDERFFMYGEDLDWAYRMKAHGWRICYFPGARVTHLKGATSRRQSYRMIVEFYRAMALFYRKHYAHRSMFLLNWLVMVGIVLRGLLAVGANALRSAGDKRVT